MNQYTEKKGNPFPIIPGTPLSKKSSKELGVLNSNISATKKAVIFLQILKDIEDNTITDLLPKFTPKQQTIIEEIISFHATQKIKPLLSNKENLNISSPQTSTENLLLCFSKNLPVQQKLFFLLTGIKKIRNLYQNLLDITQCNSDMQARDTLVKNLAYLSAPEQLDFFTICISYGFEIPLQRIAQHNQFSLRETPIISILEICFKEKQANALNEIIKLYEIMLKNEDSDCIKTFTHLLFSDSELQKETYTTAKENTNQFFAANVFNFIKHDLIPLAHSLELTEGFISFLKIELHAEDHTQKIASKECSANTKQDGILNTSLENLTSEDSPQSLQEIQSLADELAQVGVSSNI